RDIDHPIFEVISQISHDYGAEIRYENTATLGALGNQLTVGFQPAHESLANKQYQNDRGSHGPLTKDQRDGATTLAVYAEDLLSLTPRFSAVLGVRTQVRPRGAQAY